LARGKKREGKKSSRGKKVVSGCLKESISSQNMRMAVKDYEANSVAVVEKVYGREKES